MAKKIVLAGACRTAIGTMGGTLSTTSSQELGAAVIRDALGRTGIKPEQVDFVYMGCVLQAGLGQNVPLRRHGAETSLFFQEGKDAERPRMWSARSAPDEEAPRFSAFRWE